MILGVPLKKHCTHQRVQQLISFIQPRARKVSSNSLEPPNTGDTASLLQRAEPAFRIPRKAHVWWLKPQSVRREQRRLLKSFVTEASMVEREPFSPSPLQSHIMWEPGLNPEETITLDKGPGKGNGCQRKGRSLGRGFPVGGMVSPLCGLYCRKAGGNGEIPTQHLLNHTC